MNSDYIDCVLTALKVIAMIKEGQKVCIRNGQLTVETQSSGLITSFKRWIHRDSRSSTMTFIKSVVNNALVIASIHTAHREPFLKALSNTEVGLTSLAVTYADDPNTVAMIQILKEKIRTKSPYSIDGSRADSGMQDEPVSED